MCSFQKIQINDYKFSGLCGPLNLIIIRNHLFVFVESTTCKQRKEWIISDHLKMNFLISLAISLINHMLYEVSWCFLHLFQIVYFLFFLSKGEWEEDKGFIGISSKFIPKSLSKSSSQKEYSDL